MAIESVDWFLLFSVVLQLTVAARLALERETWKRLGAALFALNVVLTPRWVWTIDVGSTVAMFAALADGLTGTLILLLVLALPRPRRQLRPVAVVAVGLPVAVTALFASGRMAEPEFIFAAQGLPVLAGYIAVVFATMRVVRTPGPDDTTLCWILGAFLVRAVEFPVRFLPTQGWFGPFAVASFYGLAMVILAALVVLLAALLVAALRRDASRRGLPFLGLLMALGVVLGVVDYLPGASSLAETEILRRFSLVTVRPAFVAIGAFGTGAVYLFIPLVIAAVGAAVTGALAPALLPGPGLQMLLAAAVALACLALAWIWDLPGRMVGGGPPPVIAPSADPPLRADLPRWQALLVALSENEGGEDERSGRSGLAKMLGVEARNVHRIVVDANDAGRRLLKGASDTPLVTWTRRRGRGNQWKFFYALTPEGRAVATDLARLPPPL